MRFEDFFCSARSTITIVGTGPLTPHLESSAQFFADLLTLNADLVVTILCESDSELFSQSLCTDTDFSSNRASFAALAVHRDRIMGRARNDGLKAAVAATLPDYPFRDSALDRFVVKQANLRLPVNLIEADGRLWMSITSHSLPTIDSYLCVDEQAALAQDLRSFIGFYTSRENGQKYLSAPGEEMIQLYDRKGYPRGIFPKACFNTTEFVRYSIWGFVFNREGQMLLHQRSNTATDGRGLWDKSVGGHVDLLDSSTYITAQRELVEELFLPFAEYSKYVRADLGDIVNFGDWDTAKRPERAAREEIAGLDRADWVMFRATDDNGDPLTVTRVSDRRLHIKTRQEAARATEKEEVIFRKTVFRSDVYLFIAPPKYLDTEQQMGDLLRVSERTGAASSHKLVTVDELRAWIAQEEKNGRETEMFTDDILFINQRFHDLLERFSAFARLTCD